MSEALSSSEIEDVLSSIRRLVSDDLRPSPKGAPAVVGDKLILTPALRVVQNDSEPPAIEEVVAAVGAAVDSQSDEWESETGDEQAQLAEVSQEWMMPQVDDTAEREGDDVAEAADAFDPSQADETLFPEPDEARDDIGQQVDEVLVGKSEEANLPGWAQQGEDDDSAEQDRWETVSLEPDAAWADEAEAKIVQELSAGLPPEMDEDEIILNAREVPIDEDMLREIVRDVLREELQGRLGERITRNIRKLVRAEIARVMATDDLL